MGLDINKLLVPTPPATGNAGALIEYRKKTVISGFFSSFGDAPDGFSEEIKEFRVSFGAEYWYNNKFALRTGYSYENKNKGGRQFITAGAGVKYNKFGFNISYGFPKEERVKENPLSNNLRFTVTFNTCTGNTK